MCAILSAQCFISCCLVFSAFYRIVLSSPDYLSKKEPTWFFSHRSALLFSFYNPFYYLDQSCEFIYLLARWLSAILADQLFSHPENKVQHTVGV